MAANNKVVLGKNPIGNKKKFGFNNRKVAIMKHLPMDTCSHKRKNAGILISKISRL